MKAFKTTGIKHGSKADRIRSQVEGAGLDGWELDRQRKLVEQQGYVTADQLVEMRDLAKIALKRLDDAMANAVAVTGKAVIEIEETTPEAKANGSDRALACAVPTSLVAAAPAPPIQPLRW